MALYFDTIHINANLGIPVVSRMVSVRTAIQSSQIRPVFVHGGILEPVVSLNDFTFSAFVEFKHCYAVKKDILSIEGK